MALVAASLRAAYSDTSRAFQYSFLLFIAAVFALVGGYFMAGQAVLSYEYNVSAVIVSLIFLFLFSYIFVWFSSDLSEYLGHRTYLSREEYLFRGFRVFVLWIAVYLLTYVLYNYTPLYFAAVLTFLVSLLSIYASVTMAIDGYTLFSSLKYAFIVLREQWYHVLEFVLLSFLLLLPISVIDVVGGLFGSVFAVALVFFVVLPWLSSHAVLTYLYRYPMVVAVLSRLERL